MGLIGGRRRGGKHAKIEYDYLKFEALESGTFTLTIPAAVTATYVQLVDYSVDGGNTWVSTENDNTNVTITTPTIAEGDYVLWRGIATRYYNNSTSVGAIFSATGNFNISGNILTLLYSKNYIRNTQSIPSYAFRLLFMNCTTLISAENLDLTENKINLYTFGNMFNGCSNLIEIPDIKNIDYDTAGEYAYYGMFRNCTSLTTAKLPPSTSRLSTYGLGYMYANCTNLVNIPDITFSNTIGTYALAYMFTECINLINAPNITIKNTSVGIFLYMFFNCSALVNAPAHLYPETVKATAYYAMFRGCSSLINPPIIHAKTVEYQGFRLMFYQCTSLVTAPSLDNLMYLVYNATGQHCYMMFAGCFKLENGPKYLRPLCGYKLSYSYMFDNCRKLKKMPEIYLTKAIEGATLMNTFLKCSALTETTTLFIELINENSSVYQNLFANDINLNKVISLNTIEPSTGYAYNWLYNTKSTGTFFKNPDATWDSLITREASTVPAAWTISNASLYMFVDDFPEDVWNSDGLTLEDYIDNPLDLLCDLYYYSGNSVQLSGQTAYIWNNVPYPMCDTALKYLLTTTIDPSTLISLSLAYNPSLNTNTFDAFICTTDNNTTFTPYIENTGADFDKRLVKIFAEAPNFI